MVAPVVDLLGDDFESLPPRMSTATTGDLMLGGVSSGALVPATNPNAAYPGAPPPSTYYPPASQTPMQQFNSTGGYPPLSNPAPAISSQEFLGHQQQQQQLQQPPQSQAHPQSMAQQQQTEYGVHPQRQSQQQGGYPTASYPTNPVPQF